MKPLRAALLLYVLLASLPLPAFGNPFMSTDESAQAVPAVRAPTSRGPLLEAQRDLRERAASAIRGFKGEASLRSLAALLGAALVYGVLHAAGPGHRKTVVFSLFLGRKAAAWEPLAAGFLAAGVHAGAGVALVGVLSLIRGAVAGLGDTERASALLDGGTFGAIAMMTMALVVAKALRMLRGAREDEKAPGRGGLYGVVLVSSLVPCPGATMVLLFALYADIAWLGVVAVLAMSLGMGLVISLAGYLAYAGREGLYSRLKANSRVIGAVSDGLELVSYLLVAAFSVYMAWPFYAGLFGR